MNKDFNEALVNQSTDQLFVSTLRTLAIDMVQKANSGHPGAPMGCAPMAHALWNRHLKHNPKNPSWINRDRFILSNGHASALLYALLHTNGYDLSIEDLKNFRQWGSRTPGHPENHLTKGIETTTGPLGQGFANAVGFAIAEAHLAATYNKSGHNIIDHYTYVIAGDGCLMEGVSAEAASLAGHLGLSKLIVLYDDNGITIDGTTQFSFTEDVAMRFQAYGWNTLKVGDGNDIDAIDVAIAQARSQNQKPTLILVKTQIGFGSPNMQNTPKVHGSPLGDEEIKLTKKSYNWPEDASFFVPKAVIDERNRLLQEAQKNEESWNQAFEAYKLAYPSLASELLNRFNNILPTNWDQLKPFEPSKKGLATRAASGKILEQLHLNLPQLIGGSADLAESNKTLVKSSGNFTRDNRSGRNIFFGVREHAMGSICNGLALHGGCLPYGATFLVFSDYMRHTIRLGALEQAKSFWIWTHDSIGLGEDGPTHQPIEHFASLRAIPNFLFIRPGDANETLEALKLAISDKRPVGIALSRQNCETLDRNIYAPAENLKKGAYILISDPNPKAIIIATGSELDIAINAYHTLKEQNIPTRVVSMPCISLFEEQSQQYKDEVLPPTIKNRVVVEAAIKMGWEPYLTDSGTFIGMNSFGASAPAEILYEKFGITSQAIVDAIKKHL